MKRKIVHSAFTAFISFYIISGVFNSCQSSIKENKENNNSQQDSTGVFAGDKACGSCHAKEYDDWKTSDHYHSMLPANDSTVEGDFNNTAYSADGVTSHFLKRNGKYILNTQGSDGANHDYEIKYVFGIRPLQQYLIRFPNGNMQVARQSWDVNQKRWFHQDPNRKVDPHDWLHWTGRARNWNAACADCHSTNLQTNYHAAADTFRTTWSMVNVSCESCHGAGKKHVDYISSAEYKRGEKVPGSYLVLHTNQSSKEQITTCAPCHSRRIAIDESPFKSLQLLDHYIPETPHTPAYNADGQIHDEDYEFASFTQSRMFMHDVKCSNCHNPHSGKLLVIGNTLCLHCHDKNLDLPTHTFHAVNSEGAQCINCHMPSKVYMGNDLRRDHSFRVPRPDQSVQYGTPNACNNCHADKTPKWAAEQVVKWYGPSRRYHFSDDLIPGSIGNFASAKYLQTLAAPDTNVPSIIHATALYYMSFANDPKNISLLLEGLKDSDALVRYEALSSLKFYPLQQWKSAAALLLNDPVKGVRIAAADLFLQYADSLINDFHASFSSAQNELYSFLEKNSSEPSGRMMEADVQSRAKSYPQAENNYLAALKMDSLLIQARLNLTSMYDIIGEKEKALKQLKIAISIDPANEQVNYFLALLYVEMNNNEAALPHFVKAAAVTRRGKVFYNYGLLLEQMKRDAEAEKIYKKGLQVDANDVDLNYATAIYYYNHKRRPEAAACFLRLTQLMPDNIDFQRMYNQVKNEK